MYAMPIALSSRWTVDDAERMVRTRLDRGEAARVYASLQRPRQLRALRQLFHRLHADAGLSVSEADVAGRREVIVAPAGAESVGSWSGEFKTI